MSDLEHESQPDTTPAFIVEFRARVQWVLDHAMATPSDFRGPMDAPLASADEEFRSVSQPCATRAVRVSVRRALREG